MDLSKLLSFQANNIFYNEHFPAIFSRQANLLLALGFEGFVISLLQLIGFAMLILVGIAIAKLLASYQKYS